MHALVTGAGGFLGRYIVERLLAQGARVTGFARGSYPDLEKPCVRMIRADVRDAEALVDACRGIDVVFHTAAIAGIWGPWEGYHSINTQGTLNVIRACQKKGVGRLIYTSSPSVTFDGEDQCGVDESAPYPKRWLCHYPHSKALAEQAVLQANGQDGVLTCALRPHLIWGPRDPHLVPRLYARGRAGQLRRVGDGKNLIDMIYVENAAAAHLAAARALANETSPAAGKAYFLGQDEPVNCWDWINRLLEAADIPPVTQGISFSAAWRIGAFLEGVHRLFHLSGEPRMTRFLAAQLGKSHYFDIRAARRDFGFRPSVTMEEGLDRWKQSLSTVR